MLEEIGFEIDYLVRNRSMAGGELDIGARYRSCLSSPVLQRYLSTCDEANEVSIDESSDETSDLRLGDSSLSILFSVVVEYHSQKEEGVGREEDSRGKGCSHHLSRRLSVCACYGLCVDSLVWWVTTLRLG